MAEGDRCSGYCSELQVPPAMAEIDLAILLVYSHLNLVKPAASQSDCFVTILLTTLYSARYTTSR